MERTKCEIYSRVMGYIRNYNNFNIGKKQEFDDRVNFNYLSSINSKFINEYK